MDAFRNLTLTTVRALAVIGGMGIGVLFLRHSLRRIVLHGGEDRV